MALVALVALFPAPARAQLPELDGRIAFVKSGAGDGFCCGSAMFTINPDGTGAAIVRPYRGTTDADTSPSFSPEGLRIAYLARDCSGPLPTSCIGPDIYVMLADGSFPTLLTYEPGVQVFGPSRPSWHPSGVKLAYDGLGDQEEHLDLYETTIVGLLTTNLTDTPDFSEHAAEYSPDGRRIAFIGGPGGPGGQVVDSEIYMIDADGTNRRQITRGVTPLDLDWSPDGQTIAFSAQVSEPGAMNGVGYDIFTIDLQGGSVTRLTDAPGSDSGPAYSPDGRKIAYSASVERNPGNPFGQYDVFTMNADGTDPVNITSDPKTHDGGPDWGAIASGAVAPLPVPPPVVDACPAVEEKLVIPGTKLADPLRGSSNADVLLSGRRAGGSFGLGGDDCLFARQGDDALKGGPGDDVLGGGRGRDLIRCGAGSDTAMADRKDKVSRSCEQVE